MGCVLQGGSVGGGVGFESRGRLARLLADVVLRSLVETSNNHVVALQLQAVDRAIADKGARVVLLLRLSPLVPFTLLNYLCGLTLVRS